MTQLAIDGRMFNRLFHHPRFQGIEQRAAVINVRTAHLISDYQLVAESNAFRHADGYFAPSANRIRRTGET